MLALRANGQAPALHFHLTCTHWLKEKQGKGRGKGGSAHREYPPQRHGELKDFFTCICAGKPAHHPYRDCPFLKKAKDIQEGRSPSLVAEPSPPPKGNPPLKGNFYKAKGKNKPDVRPPSPPKKASADGKKQQAS